MADCETHSKLITFFTLLLEFFMGKTKFGSLIGMVFHPFKTKENEMDSAKAFDVKDLEARLKAKGVPELRHLGRIAVDEVFAWIEAGALAQSSPLWKLVPPLLESVKGEVEKFVDPDGAVQG